MSGVSHPLNWWLANDIILAQGIVGFVTDLGIYKVGDGVNKFSLLSFQSNPIVYNWFNQFKPIQNQDSSLSTAYNNALIGGSLVQQGDWCDFKYIINTAGNTNEKNIYLKFANQIIYSLTGILNDLTIQIKGEIVSIDYVNKKVSYKIEYIDNSGTVAFLYGNLTGIDLSQNNSLILQLQGVATNDLIAQEGKGIYCSITLPSSIT